MRAPRLVRISIIILAIVIAAGGLIWHRYLRGVGPAFLTPPKDITTIINTTDMPLQLPPGFSISVYAKNLGKPRVMTYAPGGDLLVSDSDGGRILAVRDRDGDGVAEDVAPILTGLNRPHGITFRCREACQLYVAESHAVSTYDYDGERRLATNRKEIVALPDGGNHFTRTIMFLPVPHEDEFLISVGSSCNSCEETDSRRARVLIANADGSNLRTFASGLRNSVFLGIHPVDGKIWATEMGRDFLGDNLPPDEINILEDGKNYGWPYCYGKNVQDPFGVRRGKGCEGMMPSTSDIPAHSAPLGFAFVPEEGWPESWWYDLIVAYHGSWNRSTPTGYKLVRYDLDAQGNVLGVSDFITGWLEGRRALGRPVDVLIQPGGTMFVSDDHAGVIYRIRYDGSGLSS